MHVPTFRNIAQFSRYFGIGDIHLRSVQHGQHGRGSAVNEIHFGLLTAQQRQLSRLDGLLPW